MSITTTKMENIVFHPPLVHFPIAFYCLELLLLLFWRAKKDPAHLRFARFSFNLGYLFMLAAIVAGLKDAGGLAKWENENFHPSLRPAIRILPTPLMDAFFLAKIRKN